MEEPLFVPGKTISLEATTGQFTAKDRFILGMDPGRVMISYIEGGFPKWFLQKVEEPVAASTLRFYELQRDAPDDSILAELGGEKKVETTLSEVWALMERQRRGEDGILAINGWGNIFYIRDASSTLREVAIHWCEGGWFVEANRLRGEAWWPVRDRVFTRVTT